DDESLQRAYVIARRLRGLEIPAFQDTYGWISFRMGNQQEALENLEPAAEGLPKDPSVQYHLAKVYLAAGRAEEAAAKLQAAVDLWAESKIPLAETARAELAAMSAPAAIPAAAPAPAAPASPSAAAPAQ
ncbi:MAG: tetratricopeptide repeat protein, partial [Mangrovicoccus sp.]|nr:tetratricopeptide repeat protein [Mangrovicoccus sp.]